MNYSVEKNHIILSGIADFSPRHIFECGQCFRWNLQSDGSYLGVAFGKAARVRALEDGRISISGTLAEFDEIWRQYFDLDRDYSAVRAAVAIDDYMVKACSFGKGIRILRQDRWEALCSFIISQCNNIPRIKGIIERLCTLYGQRIEFEGQILFAFPGPERLAGLRPADLEALRCGYRAQYILEAARAVDSGVLDLEALAKAETQEAMAALKSLPGVGDKVARCVLLYGLHRLEAFPIDVWIRRTLEENYGKAFDPSVFGNHAGIAQQYMFYYARSGKMEV